MNAPPTFSTQEELHTQRNTTNMTTSSELNAPLSTQPRLTRAAQHIVLEPEILVIAGRGVTSESSDSSYPPSPEILNLPQDPPSETLPLDFANALLEISTHSTLDKLTHTPGKPI